MSATRPYLLSSSIEGVKDRIVQASSQAQALAIAARTTWDATPANPATVRAFKRLGVEVEVQEPTQGDLLTGAEGGEGCTSGNS
jgi:hypothetical protein